MTIGKFHPVISEVYFYTIDLTTEALQKYLQRPGKPKYKHNVSFELRKRWQERLECLLHSVSGVWSRFQEYNGKSQEHIKQSAIAFPLKEKERLSPFSLVCKISWNITEQLDKNENVSGFKSWVWNCLVSQMKNEDYFQKALILNQKSVYFLEKIHAQINSKNQFKYKKDMFSRYKLIVNINFGVYKNFKNNIILPIKKTNQFIIKTRVQNSESLGSEYDPEIDSQIVDEKKETTLSSFILCVANKVYRRSERWKVLLRDGIVHINGKDLVFNSCKCEFFW